MRADPDGSWSATPAQGPPRGQALVVCRGNDGRGDTSVPRAARWAGLEPIVVPSTVAAHEMVHAMRERHTPFSLVVVDADVDEPGDGVDLAMSVGFECPETPVVLMHRRAVDDVRDPVLGLRLADLRCDVLRHPVRSNVLAPMLARIVRSSARTRPSIAR